MAAHLVAQACSGLHAAHELRDDEGVLQEVVHRDATPHNFMITAAGELKVMDFGIVKSKNQQHQATQNGELKGKISYLAPEQIRGRRVDRRADIFTLGGVLYVSTVGKGAFNPDMDQDAGRIIHRILSGEYAPPLSLLTDYPPELEAIVARALTTAPEQRYQTADEMRVALEAFLEDGSRSVTREDVAALLQEHCGAAIERRRSEIRGAQRLFDSQSGALRSGTYPAAEKSFDIGTLLSSASQSVGEHVSDDSKSSPQPVPSGRQLTRRYRALIYAAMAGSMLLLGSLGAVTLFALRQAASGSANQVVGSPSRGVDPPPGRPPVAPAPQAKNLRADAEQPAHAASAGELSLAPTGDKADGVTKKSRRTGLQRSVARAPLLTPAPIAAATEATPPASTPNNQFAQPLTRKPPRHAIDENDPFGQ
jgi:serine/threonine-protein kinase